MIRGSHAAKIVATRKPLPIAKRSADSRTPPLFDVPRTLLVNRYLLVPYRGVLVRVLVAPERAQLRLKILRRATSSHNAKYVPEDLGHR